MKKILTTSLLAVSITACNTTAKSISYAMPTANKTDKAVGQIKANDQLISVKFITDGRQVMDKSFNQAIWKGVSAYAGAALPTYSIVPTDVTQVALETTYQTAFETTQMLVVGGNQHIKPVSVFSEKIETNKGMILIDDEVKKDNILNIVFKTTEASFYAGYGAADYLNKNIVEFDTKSSKGLKVGVYGGMDLEPVVAFMSGFQQGIAYYNSTHKDSTKVEFIKLGAKKDSYFTGSFQQGGGKGISEKLVNEGADIILPVAASQILDTLEVIRNKKARTLVIGVDTNQVELYIGYSDKFLTSIQKNIGIAVKRGLISIYGGTEYTGYGLGYTLIGTVENDLLSLATSGDNKLLESDYHYWKTDPKISIAAKDAINKFNL